MIIGEGVSIGGSGGSYPSVFFKGDDLTSSGSVSLVGEGKTYNGVWASKVISGVVTNGFLISHITDYGTYTYTVTEGTKTKSGTVVIDTVCDYEVEIELKLYLYNLGDECEEVTGGWSINTNGIGTGTLTKNDNNMVLYSYGTSDSNNTCLQITNAVSLDGYTKLKIECSVVGFVSGKNNVGIFVNTTKMTSGGYKSSPDATVNYDVSSTLNELNISYSTSKYIGVRTWAFSSTSLTTTINKIWLE